MALQLLENLATFLTQRTKINAAISTINDRVLDPSGGTIGKTNETPDVFAMVNGVPQVLDLALDPIYVNDFAQASDTEWEYTGTEAKWFAFDGVASINVNTVNVTVTFKLRVNAVEKLNTLSIIRLSNSADYQSITANTMIYLEPGDLVDLIAEVDKTCTMNVYATQLRLLEVV